MRLLPRRSLWLWLPLLFVTLCSCANVPITGRQQFRGFVSPEEEIALGLDAYPEITKEYQEITSGPQYEMVQRAMHRLTPFADPLVREQLGTEFAWECKLLKADDTVNAWCLPGGKMAFYTGILPICEDEAGVAVVMGHEIAHAVASHAAERISNQTLLQSAIVAGALALGDDPADAERNDLIIAALGIGAQVGVMLPYSRTHEAEADEIGLHFLVQAGYDPYAAVRLWERMAKLGGERGPEFLSTHPAPESRAERLRELIPQVMQKYGRSAGQ